ncbi:neurofilament medium polypeptide-like isoform X6 [Physella acuta]|uniref:neurofilament medium polypeptide-like isoform X6 n=1 Tax=Physella acuta TaxID=109671 RepID=UPI0027DBC4AA|nr:neurofilament medium polypeptide-like isoform X6 [Physella acuta]
MHGRGGFPIKNVIYAVFIMLLIYMTYLYNGSQNRLRDAEMNGMRFKRESEEKLTEIQDLIKAKDRFQEACKNEKGELNNRIKSINQQHTMLQSQYKEIESDLMKLKDDMEKMRLENEDEKSQHLQEFQTLKQEKENEITACKDEVANLKRSSDQKVIELESKLVELKNKISEDELSKMSLSKEAQKSLVAENSRLQQAHNQLQLNNQQPPRAVETKINMDPVGNNFLNGPTAAVQNMKIDNLDREQQKDNLDQVKPDESQRDKSPDDNGGKLYEDPAHRLVANNNHDLSFKRESVIGNDNKDLGVRRETPLSFDMKDHLALKTNFKAGGNADLDEMNAHHQVRPPVNNGLDNDNEQIRNGLDTNQDERPEINPNDAQKGQILGPYLGKDKDEQRNEGHRENSRREDYNMDTGVKVDEDDNDVVQEHKAPLALGQIQEPNAMDNGLDGAKSKVDGQQMPPIINEENERNENAAGFKDLNPVKRKENQYFGEDGNAQKLDIGEEEQQGEDEQDREGRDDRDQFPEDQANQENDNQDLDAANN